MHTDIKAHSLSTSVIITTGILALAVAMGIGRFAFTPLLPLMLRDGTIEGDAAHYWASANYLGYLLGALTAARLHRHTVKGLKYGLLGTALMTLALGWLDTTVLALMGAMLRFGCGVLSAWILVCASSWCLTQLTNLNANRRASWIYTGVGAGIALTGVLTWLGGQLAAATLWSVLGFVALALTLFVIWQLPQQPSHTEVTRSSDGAISKPMLPRYWRLILCYAISGFGYIIPATYLPSIAQQQTSNALLFGLTWPLFGLAALLSVVLVAVRLSHWPHARTWVLAQILMAAGALIPALTIQLGMLALSALLVGGTFMITTLAGLQLAREYEPQNPTPLLALMTAGFASGQIAGPVLVSLIGPATIFGLSALPFACSMAALLLIVSSHWLWQQPSAST